MSGTLSKVFIFAAGAAVGALVSWRILQPYYKKIADEEIESVIKQFSGDKSECDESDDREEDRDTDFEHDISEYSDVLRGEGYASIPKGKEMDYVTKPYVISPEDFGELEDYDQRTLFYYADGVLTDDEDNPIEDVDGVVGRGSLTHFGEYEDDSVHVRNDRFRTDYEILRELNNYADVVKTKPHHAEEE